MRSSERQQIILNMVKAESHITLSQIKEKFPDISDITIRRDLEYMDKERMLVRIRGGAKSLESIIGGAWEDSYQNRLLEHEPVFVLQGSGHIDPVCTFECGVCLQQGYL